MTRSIINFFIGIWIIVSPYALHFSDHQTLVMFHWILGVLIVGFALFNATAVPETRTSVGSSWLVAGLGILTILAPFVGHYAVPYKAEWNDVIAGVIVFLFAASNAGRSYRMLIHREL